MKAEPKCLHGKPFTGECQECRAIERRAKENMRLRKAGLLPPFEPRAKKSPSAGGGGGEAA